MMQKIGHPNVIKAIRTEKSGSYFSRKYRQIISVMFIHMEFCEKSDVFDFKITLNNFQFQWSDTFLNNY